jgi:hypothetical protein
VLEMNWCEARACVVYVLGRRGVLPWADVGWRGPHQDMHADELLVALVHVRPSAIDEDAVDMQQRNAVVALLVCAPLPAGAAAIRVRFWATNLCATHLRARFLMRLHLSARRSFTLQTWTSARGC